MEFVNAALRERRDVLVESLSEHIPEAEFVVPEGGYFLWLTLDDDVDTRELLEAAKKEGAPFVAGPDFLIEGGLQRAPPVVRKRARGAGRRGRRAHRARRSKAFAPPPERPLRFQPGRLLQAYLTFSTNLVKKGYASPSNHMTARGHAYGAWGDARPEKEVPNGPSDDDRRKSDDGRGNSPQGRRAALLGLGRGRARARGQRAPARVSPCARRTSTSTGAFARFSASSNGKRRDTARRIALGRGAGASLLRPRLLLRTKVLSSYRRSGPRRARAASGSGARGSGAGSARTETVSETLRETVWLPSADLTTTSSSSEDSSSPSRPG